MNMQRTALHCLIAAMVLASAESALAQKSFSRGPSSNIGVNRPTAPSGGGDFRGGGNRGPGWGGIVPGIIVAVPQGYPPHGPSFDGGPYGPSRWQQANRRGASGAPPANERTLVPDEVGVEPSNS